MTNAFKKIFASFLERPDVWFFYGFLITFTLSIRKVLFFYPINGTFNEYTGIYLYLSDIFLCLTVISWFIILCNKYSILSILRSHLLKCSTPVQMFHVEHYTGHAWNILIKNYIQNVPRGTFMCLKKVYKQVINNYVIIFPLFLAIFSFLSILWSSNQSVALFRSIKLFEFVLLYFYIIYNVPRLPRVPKMFHVEHFWNLRGETTLKKIEDKKCSMLAPCSENVPRGTFSEFMGWNIFSNFLIIIIISSFIQSIIGFVQFFRNSSIGLLLAKESVLSPEISGVAKIMFDGIAHIRAYGLFPHPNIFGGFLVVSIIASLLYLKMFHSETNVPSQYKCSTWNIIRDTRGTFLRIFVIIQVFALLLTFSKSAIIGLFIGFLYIAANNTLSNVPPASTREDRLSTLGGRGTFSKLPIFKMFHVEHFWKKIILLFSISALLFFIIKPDTSSLFLKSLNERSVYLNVSRGTFLENPFFGIGAGQFVVNLKNVTNLETWQFQPVHNVFLLILNEFGIFVFFGFLFFIYKMFHPNTNVPPQYKCSTWNIIRGKRGTLYGASVEHYTGQAWNIIRGRRGTLCEAVVEDDAQQAITVSQNTIIFYLKAILLAFIFVMFFDHYLWDIQQGQIMLWAILGLIVTINRKQLFG